MSQLCGSYAHRPEADHSYHRGAVSVDIHLSVSWLSHWINCGKGSSAEVNFRYFNLTSHLILCSPYPTTSVLPVYRNSCSDSFSIQSLAEVNFSVLLSLLPQYLLPLKTPASTNFAIHESIETTHQQHFHVSLLDRKSTRLNSSHVRTSRMPSSA